MALWLASASANETIEVGEAPDWVDQMSQAESTRVSGNAQVGGTQYLLVDRQVRMQAGNLHRFQRYVSRALNNGGVDDISHIEIDFDPSYQQLLLHRVEVLRDDQRFNRLDQSKIQVLQRERELEQRIYDGSKTAYLALPDIRVGDIVDYSYSIVGSNPVFEGRSFGSVSLQWAVPVDRSRLRLWFPSDHQIAVQTLRWNAQPKKLGKGGWQGYEWDSEGLQPLSLEDDAPSWFDPYPEASWSEYPDWQSVVQWATPLYDVRSDLHRSLRQIVDDIRVAHRSPSDQLHAALYWVQANVRYLGIELGASSHAPADPNIVFERRFGDCKDKARLLLAMLKALGIDAAPALVNTDRLTEQDTAQASPGYFNHVIVRAEIDGKPYWLDPTRPAQPSRLDQVVQPDFGWALVLDSGADRLTPMTASRAVPKSVRVTYDVSKGLDEPAQLIVTTVHGYRAAESFRQQLSDSSLSELSKNFSNYYANYYPGVRSTQPIDVDDEAERNRVTVTERYEIAEFWTRGEGDRRDADFYVPDMRDLLQSPNDVVRDVPLSQRYPLDMTVETDILLPEEWSIDPEDSTVENEFFEFHHELTVEPTHVRMVDRLKTKSDHVPAEAASRFAADLEKARQSLGISLYYGSEAASSDTPVEPRFNWLLAFAALSFAAVASWIARKAYRWDPPPTRVVFNPALQGLGGWLVLLAISLLISPFIILFQLADFASFFDLNHWEALTHPKGDLYHPYWGVFILFELMTTAVILVWSILNLVVFFAKRRSAPIFIASLLIMQPIVLGVDAVLADSLKLPGLEEAPKTAWEVGGAAVRGLIWATYLMVSVRVSSTFTRSWGQRQPDAVAAQITPEHSV